MSRRARARARAESGVSLVEVVVTVALLSIVSAVFLPILATATRSVHPMEVQSQSIDSLRNALAAIGREMRSAACVTAPAANAGASNSLKFTTDANNSTYEVTYTATAGQLLRQVTGESSVTLVETGLVNPDDAFTHIATPRRTVKVLFHFQPDPKEPALDLSTVVAGRNAWHAC
jgi:type II secretory pathway component PulJ